MPQPSNHENDSGQADSVGCSICTDLLASLNRFFVLIGTAQSCGASEWLTVDEVAGELKVSKAVVYRLIRNCELKAVNLARKSADNGGDEDKRDDKGASKGCYRVQRRWLKAYLDSKIVKPLPGPLPEVSYQPRRRAKVQDHLGL